MARVNRAFVVGSIAAVLGFHTLLLGGALLVLGTHRVFLFGALTAGTGLLFVGGGLWRAIRTWGTDDPNDDSGDDRARKGNDGRNG